MTQNVIIVEDTPLGTKRLNTLLQNHLDMHVLAEFNSISAAWDILESGQIQGVLLDINFVASGGGETDGLILAKNISFLKPCPWIIFVTGKQEYVYEAIEIVPPNVLYGFICKPIDQAKFDSAIAKVRQHLQPQPPLVAPTQRIELKYKQIQIINGHVEKITVQRVIEPCDIIYIKQETNVNVYLSKRYEHEVLKDVHMKLCDWDKLLMQGNVDYFQQIHKQTIVNLHFCSGICSGNDSSDGYFALMLENSTPLKVGHKYLAAFKAALQQGRRTDPL